MRKMAPFNTLLAVFMVFCIFTPAGAEKPAWKVIQPEALHQMLEKKSDFTLINTMSFIECRDHSIPKSLCLPCETLEKRIGKLPDDKDKKLVFYCESDLCLRSYKAAEKALKNGYTDVSVLKDGFPGWKKAGYEVISQERIPRRAIPSVKAPLLKTWMEEKKSLFILDIRSEDAFKDSHIDGAVNIPFYLLDAGYDVLPLDRKILVVDERGFRSFLAASYLARKGFDVTRLFGGMEQWQKLHANAKRRPAKK
jgi:rhodanese-related sulfurtransferase